MKYRHSFHAGNFADIHKHITLLALLAALKRKDKGFAYFETHAGRGRYELNSTREPGGTAGGGDPRAPELKNFAGRVSDSGEGRWTILAAVEEGAPAHVLTAALYDRFTSRGEAEFASKVLSALRFQFGGHHEKKA